MSTYGLVAWADHWRVGTLTYNDDTGLFTFIYASDWMERQNAFLISPAIPFERPANLTPELHSARVRRFFENLLPEGRALDDAAMAHAVSKANLYGLLRALGSESTGALSLLPEGVPPGQGGSHREISPQELSERIRDRASQPFNVWDGRVRMSIAGHQDKLAVYMENERLFLADGHFASTHILKPEPLAPRLAGLVANEYFCLTLAKALGVPAAPARILRVPEPVLVVERFDRRIGREGVDRLHIIDACQALDLSVSHKYERPFGSGRDVAHIREGVSLPRLFSIAPLALAEASLRIGLLRWLIVQFLIGNSDAHGKNLSVFVEPGGLTLAPAYDLVAVCIYPDLDQELAMAIGDTFDLANVRAFDWAEFADRCGIKRPLLAREMARLARAARKAVAELREHPGYTDAEHQVIDRIADFVLAQALRLARDAEFVPSVER